MSPITANTSRNDGAESEHENDHYDRTLLWSAWKQYHQPMCRMVAQRAARPVADPDVHDAVTDALLRLDRAFKSDVDIDRVSGWLATVAWREYLRRNGRDGQRRRFEKTSFLRAERVEAFVGPEDVAMVRAGQRAQRRALDLALRTLSPGQRETFELFAQGASYEQIAVARGTTIRAVERANIRARRQLRMSDLVAREAVEWAS